MIEYIIYGLIIGGVIAYYSKKNKKLSPEEIAAKEAEIKENEAKRIALEEKRKAERIELQRIQKLEEEKLLKELLNSSERVYFSYSLVNETSSLFLINPSTNNLIEASETSLKNLYADNWKLKDIDKTGKSAQLEDFNFVVRVSKSH